MKTNTYLVNYGTSLIWLTAETFNLMLEAVGYTAISESSGSPVQINNFFLLNPGFRYAFNFISGLQIVPGLAVPVSLAPADGNFGIFVYLSFEGPVWKGHDAR